jgi:hypothetical protein
MAGNIPLTGAVQLKLVWSTASGPQSLNILHCQKLGVQVINTAFATAVDTAVKGAFTSSSLNLAISTTVSLTRVEVRDLGSLENPWFLGGGAAVPGAAADNMLPPQVAMCVSLNTAKRGRSFHGRTYLWGFTVTSNDATGAIAGPSAAAGTTFMETIRTTLAGGTTQLTLGVLSRFWTPPGTDTTVERSLPVLTPVVSCATRDTRWDTQRRRADPGI